MNKKQIKMSLLAICPPIPGLRSMIAKYEAGKYTRHLQSKEAVLNSENDIQKKREFVAAASEKNKKRAKADNLKIDQLLQTIPDFQGLDDVQKEDLRTDILFCRFAYGFMPDEYVCFNFISKTNPAERKSFISESDHMRYCYKMNDPVDICVFNDKEQTYRKFGPYYHREIIAVSKKSDREKYLDYVKRHPVFVKKQVFESCGNSIERIDLRTGKQSENILFESFLSQGKVILEEVVEQGEETAIFNKSSVNTIRCITFNTSKGIFTPYCFMKIGRDGSFVDNGGAGGILVGIDKDTGITNTDGYDERRRIYEIHPDSGVKFSGHQLPEWSELLTICKEMAKQMPSVRFIGWDLAYAKDYGWVVIEGNGMSQFIGPQTIWQKGIKKEVIALMKNM